MRQHAARQSQPWYGRASGIVGIHTDRFPGKVPLLEQKIDTGLARSARKRRDPARFTDYIPTSTVPSQLTRQFLTKKQRLEAAKERAAALQPEGDLEPLPGEYSNEEGGADPEVPPQIATTPDDFGIFRKYLSIPSHNPDDADPFDDIPSAPAPTSIGSELSVSSARHADSNPLADSKNPTEDLLLGWWSEGSCDGIASLDRLVKCLTSQYFDPSRLKDFNAVSAVRQFEKQHCSSKPGTTLEPGDGWKVGSVKIRLPCTKVKQREEDAPEFTVDGILYRDAAEVITKELQDPDSFERIHLKPFEEWWKPSESDDPVRVYSDVYTSDTMLEADRKLQESLKATSSAGPHLETFIVSAGLYSDSTNLAAFSSASLWPMYMYIANESKYVRAKPTSFSAHHIAYLPTVQDLDAHLPFLHFSPFSQLPDSIKEFYYQCHGVYPTADVLAHLKRELIHASLRLIFRGSFADAQNNGQITRCADDIVRRWLLQLVFHSADYIKK